MNLEQINEIIDSYGSLLDLAKSKIKVIEKLDSIYSTSRGIEKISFGKDFVYVVCDDSSQGCYDSLFFEFPVSWLLKTDAELEDIILLNKRMKVEQEQREKVEKQLKAEEELKQREFQQYQRLKSKFG
jgi:hypothetical protein